MGRVDKIDRVVESFLINLKWWSRKRECRIMVVIRIINFYILILFIFVL